MLRDKSQPTSCTYRIISETYLTHKHKDYQTYGIQAISRKKDDMQVYQTVSDISTDKIQVDEMIRMFNRFHLSQVHLMDVIEDMLP